MNMEKTKKKAPWEKLKITRKIPAYREKGKYQPVLPDAKPENQKFQSQNPERFSRVSVDCLKSIFLNQIINNVVLFLHEIYLNETIENRHQNIVNSKNKKLSLTHFAVNIHVVF
jgi:hypothetical protein